ncbi:TPA: hypothetical protein QCH65_000450 [Enterobacter roggenkampii]|nr:hypothetical protein [Enterobacter roggenkampii]
MTINSLTDEELEDLLAELEACGIYGRQVRALAELQACRKVAEPIAWINEDELPEGYPYDAMFPFSKVDIVRLFPVYAPLSEPERAELQESRRLLEGVPRDAIEGGWTARGLSNYAKKLEAELQEYRKAGSSANLSVGKR